MKLGRVVGTVWATRKVESLVGTKLLLVQDLDLARKLKSTFVVAVDGVGAGASEIVLYASGSSARQTPITTDRPVDAVIMAIVDHFEVSDRDE